MLTLTAWREFVRILSLRELTLEFKTRDSLRIGSTLLLTAFETQLKLVGPWLTASAIALPIEAGDDVNVLGITLNFHQLLLAASLTQLLQRYLPELRRWILFGIGEQFAEQRAMGVLAQGLQLATATNPTPLSNLTTTLSKQLCSADLHPFLYLSATTDQIYPALFDIAGGILYSSHHFSLPTTCALIAYMAVNLLVNYAINWLADVAPKKNQLMLFQNHYHTQSYAMLSKAITIELHQRRNLELQYLHTSYTQYRHLKQKITQLERIPALQYLCVMGAQLIALSVLYLQHLTTLPTEQTVFLFIYLGTLSAQFASLSSGWRGAATASLALAELRHYLGNSTLGSKLPNVNKSPTDWYQPLLSTEADELIPSTQHPIALHIQRLSFWHDSTRRTLNEITLTIPCGANAALVGTSHCGKSTLTRLILGLLATPHPEHMQLFGQATDQIAQAERYRLIYLVTQDADDGLFTEESVAYNVMYAYCDDHMLGELRADPSRLNQPEYHVLKQYFIQLCVQTKLEHLADRPNCQGLSGGEKQRIKIARALASQAPFVILDEATSQLDARTEAEVLNHVRDCLNGRTLLFVSHKLSTVRHCNPIFVLKSGANGTQLVEEGSHAALLAAHGEYANLWQLQHA